LVACETEPVDLPDADTDISTEVDTEAVVAAWPSTLSETGLYADIANGTLATGVRVYTPAFPLWSDGAVKERFFALPDGAVIDTTDPNLWDFPEGTRAWKTFISDGVRVETRYIERMQDDWIWVSYQWRDDGSNADVVPDGVSNASGTEHDIPNQEACFRCHQAAGLLGVGAIQLGDDNPDALLDLWTDEGLLSEPISESTAVPGEGLEHDVLGYLHGNCSGCHIDSYYLADAYDLRLGVPVGTASVSDSPVMVTGVNGPTRHQNTTAVAIAPGDPNASQLAERMATREVIQMPPIGTELVDTDAVQDVRDWIAGLPAQGD
jgi:hypothetical protein